MARSLKVVFLSTGFAAGGLPPDFGVKVLPAFPVAALMLLKGIRPLPQGGGRRVVQ